MDPPSRHRAIALARRSPTGSRAPVPRQPRKSAGYPSPRFRRSTVRTGSRRRRPRIRREFASAITSAAPCARQAEAARTIVPPVLIMSSSTIAVRPSTSPAKRSPVTFPRLRLLSTSPFATLADRARSSVRRKSSTRFSPPGSGETTATRRRKDAGPKRARTARRCPSVPCGSERRSERPRNHVR